MGLGRTRAEAQRGLAVGGFNEVVGNVVVEGYFADYFLDRG